LEGFGEDCGTLLCRLCGVGAKDKFWGLGDELGEVVVLVLGFFDVVSDWKEAEPVADEVLAELRVVLDKGGVEFDHFTERSDGVVTGRVELVGFELLFLGFGRDGNVYTALERS